MYIYICVYIYVGLTALGGSAILAQFHEFFKSKWQKKKSSRTGLYLVRGRAGEETGPNLCWRLSCKGSWASRQGKWLKSLLATVLQGPLDVPTKKMAQIIAGVCFVRAPRCPGKNLANPSTNQPLNQPLNQPAISDRSSAIGITIYGLLSEVGGMRR